MWLFAAQYNSICSKTLTVIMDSQPDISMSQTLSIKMGFRFCLKLSIHVSCFFN